MSENYCINSYIGVGGFYENANGNETKITNYGGFLSIGGSDVLFHRVQAGIDMKFGYGSNNLSGTNLANLNSGSIFSIDIMGKLGVNVATQNSPLFINLIFGPELILSNSGIGRNLYYIGGGIEGKLALSEKLKLTYSAGYGYIVNAIASVYSLGENHVESALIGYNQLFMASLGTQIKVSEHIDFYLKAFGKYYDLNNSKEVQVNGNAISMPSIKTWQAGLEAGISF